ncbi:Rieske 2Fe-2S domain-containing protein [Roseomonas sp. NAR14]|uniref:Rieske 2Fe-2S domain-containing protein n=1 Tax=Roseomonas acroporae TaxID=2937791 RepID=A0A9X2BUS3_9PROT|nr:Rieske 2Fe-2S domain-containing protein [Roseomonas acroporae]MCK8783269.1 Rieske 2Fe-2S domain-containing protein [Roseomonas acroporae]
MSAPTERVLCRLDEIPDGGARGFGAAPGGFTGLFAVRRGERAFVFVNSCPHIGVPLEIVPDRFLDARGELIVCSVHGARFRVADGLCVAGPCLGDSLEAVPSRVQDGRLLVPADSGL